jgi:hypothetical protein
VTWDPLAPTTPQGTLPFGALPVDGILRVGDILDEDGDLVLLVREPEHPRDPWPTLVFPIGFHDEAPFRHQAPADLAERRVRRGDLYAAADAWSTWTEGPCS